MTLSRWRRVATGVAAGVIVMCAALIGASFRGDTAGVSVASELRPANIIPIEEDPVGTDTVDQPGDPDSVQVIDTEDLLDADDADAAGDVATSDAVDDETSTGDAATGDADTGETAAVDATNGDADAGDAGDTTGDEAATGNADTSDAGEAEDATPAPAATAAPLTGNDDDLGLGGGVDDAECALDRLVIYAGARVGGVAGSIRAALAQAGFGAGCPAPITVLASNCPLQFAGVLGAGSGYDPAKSFVASSASVNRESMTAVMGAVGYSGNEINILDFSFVNPDKPGEQWMAIFIPPSFAGWETLASRAGLSPSTTSLCAPSGQLAG